VRTPEQLCAAILSATDDGAAIVARGQESFDADPLLQRAAKNVLSEIGEAVGDLPDPLLPQIGDLPWKEIRGVREKIVHDYYELDLVILWSTLETDLPSMDEHVRRWLTDR
jgi:uncharacterized protein with HEPN domain